ncbi:MAG: hypothetical protein OHK0039_42690 [Bacteroidia bacterium]
MLLSPTQTRQLFAHAFAHRYAILAINADSHAAVSDCLEAARQADAPVIIETSLWQIKGHSYGIGDPVLGVARYLADLQVLAASPRYRQVPVVYHTDHIKGPETLAILQAAIQGVPTGLPGQSPLLCASSVSLDASDLSEAENIATMRELCRLADEAGVAVALEMESAVDDRITPRDETARLIGGVESVYPGRIVLWAPGVGTQHGFTSDDGYSGFDPGIVAAHVGWLRELTGRDIGLALHGSTGLRADKLRAAAEQGVVKVNWSSESLHLRATALQRYVAEHAAQFDRKHKDWKATVMDHGLSTFVSREYVPFVAEKMVNLGAQGMGSAFMQAVDPV